MRYNNDMSTRRNYIETSEVSGATDAQVALAEEIIDQYVGVQDKHVKAEYDGEITSLLAGNKVIDASSLSQLKQQNTNIFSRCVIELVTGDAAGTIRLITASDGSDYSVTYDGDAISGIQVGDIFRIYQLAKFPRQKDQFTRNSIYYKTIPRAVKDAVIAQTQFIIEMGDDYFTGNETDAGSESIGNYSYSNASGGSGQQSAAVKMVAPRARTLLRGIVNRLGRIEV
jgi:hypothetical protein